MGVELFPAGMVGAQFTMAKPSSEVPQQQSIAISITGCGSPAKVPQILLGLSSC